MPSKVARTSKAAILPRMLWQSLATVQISLSFRESEVYPGELSALDETPSWPKTQVIVSSCMQAVSNCIVARPHYLVCCVNEREEMLVHVGAAIGVPVGTVKACRQLRRT